MNSRIYTPSNMHWISTILCAHVLRRGKGWEEGERDGGGGRGKGRAEEGGESP